MAGATISEVRIAAAHDGEAELIVTLTFANGGQSLVTLDEFAARSLLASTNASTSDQLIPDSYCVCVFLGWFAGRG